MANSTIKRCQSNFSLQLALAVKHENNLGDTEVLGDTVLQCTARYTFVICRIESSGGKP